MTDTVLGLSIESLLVPRQLLELIHVVTSQALMTPTRLEFGSPRSMEDSREVTLSSAPLSYSRCPVLAFAFGCPLVADTGRDEGESYITGRDQARHRSCTFTIDRLGQVLS